MPKNISVDMQNHLVSEVTSLATCWVLTRRDGMTYYFTDHDRDIEFQGNTYLAATGFTRSAVETSSDMAVDNMELMGILDSDALSIEDTRAGLFDYAEISSFMVNHEDPDTFNSIRLRTGFLGEVTATTQTGTFNADFRGLLQNYSQNVGSIYQEDCRADLGDEKCGIVLEPPEVQRNVDYDVGDTVSVVLDGGLTDGNEYLGRRYVCTAAGTTAGVEPVFNQGIGSTTVDGSVTWTCQYAWVQNTTVDTITSSLVFTVLPPINAPIAGDDWFKYGIAVFYNTDNSFKSFEIKGYNSLTNEVELFLPPSYAVQPGDPVRLYVGCNKNIQSGCRDKFDNVINFRGEPFVPGNDQVMDTPNAK